MRRVLGCGLGGEGGCGGVTSINDVCLAVLIEWSLLLLPHRSPGRAGSRSGHAIWR